MKSKLQERHSTCELHFNKDYKNLDALRTEISSALIVGDTLFVSYDEDAGIERLTPIENGYGDHVHYEMADFFDLPEGSDEMDMEALAYAEPYLWFCGSMSLKRNTPDKDDDLDKGVAKLAEISQDKNRFSLGCIPCKKVGDHFELQKEMDYKGKTLKPMMLKGGARSSELHNALLNDIHLKDYMNIPCKDNGFDIEGLAVVDDRIFFALGLLVLITLSSLYVNRSDVLNISLSCSSSLNWSSILYSLITKLTSQRIIL